MHATRRVCTFVLILLLTGTVVSTRPFQVAPPSEEARRFGGRTPLEWSAHMAHSEMARRGSSLRAGGAPGARWDYTSGLFALALSRLSEVTGTSAFREYGEDIVGSFVGAEGSIATYKIEEYNLDMIAPGKVVLLLYERTREERYRKAADLLRKQLAEQPRTSEGGFWHKLRYPNQMWLDGLFMAAPFYAHYGKLFGRRADQDDAVRQILLIDSHTYDRSTGLFYHGWDESRTQEWADKQTGRSPSFWGRAIGWYGMAIVDTLDFLPAAHPEMEAVHGVLRRLADGVLRHQDEKTGLWYQVVDQGGRPGNYLEASASSMYVFTIAKAVNRGYLPHNPYAAAARKGYEGLVRDLTRIDNEGRVHLRQCCEVAGLGYGRDGSYEYYLSERIVENDLKGVGPFILAGVEVERLLAAPPPAAPAKSPAGWDSVPQILARIRPPTFPAQDFSIVRYGAVADGKTDCTEAIRKAIAACSAAGGGRVIVPAGVFLTGAIHLRSNVNLHLAEGATLKFIPDPAKYLPPVFTRWEGVEVMNYSPLIYAFEQENIAVTGSGVLDGSGSADNWWAWARRGPDGRSPARASRDRLFDMGERGVPVGERMFGAGHYLRPSFIQPYRSRNVLIEGVTVRDSPMWHLHPVLCSNVTVRKVSVIGHGPNNDGCNPESCRDVLIEDCLFDTGDDCIAIKSGRNNDGRRIGVPSENIIVRGCTMKDGHGGVVMGSEISGGCRNVYIENCRMDSPNLDRALRFKSNARRGGVIEDVFMRNVEVGRVAEAVLTIDLIYEEGPNGPHRPIVRNVALENVTSTSSPRVMWIAGFPNALIENIRFADCHFRGVEEAEVLLHAGSLSFKNVTIEPAKKGRSLHSPAAAPPPGYRNSHPGIQREGLRR